MNHTEGMRHRSGEQWTPQRTSTLSISVIDKPPVPAPPGARKVPFGFGIRDEPAIAVPVLGDWEGNPS